MTNRKISLTVAYIYFFSVWMFNVWDLIYGNHFYYNTSSIIYWNALGLVGFLAIMLNRKGEKKSK